MSTYPRIWLGNIKQTRVKNFGFIASISPCLTNTEEDRSSPGEKSMSANQILKRFLTVTTALANESSLLTVVLNVQRQSRIPFMDGSILYQEAMLHLAGFRSLCCILVGARYYMNIVEILGALETLLRI
jgi:hypothetical protein